MKTAVITRHAINNYGSLLQTLATQTVIEELGHSCKIIDYVRQDETYQIREKTSLMSKPNWNNSFIKRAIYLAMRQPESIISGKKFEKMQRQYLHLTKRYSTKEELIKEKPDADCYITGSDQVWGPVGNGVYDDCYCLSFTDAKDKRFSYAASFGHTDFTLALEEYYKKWLGQYDQLLVREDSAVKRLKEWGFTAQQVIDPTLLLSREYWKKYVGKNKYKEKYILIYQLHNNARLGNYAKELAKREGLKLLRVSQSIHQITREGKLIWCPNVQEFLSLIDNAECMITDSFHGTAFAINLNTPFIEVLPNNNTETRNMSILRLTGLTDRVLGQDNDYGIIKQKINYETVNQIVERERKQSITLLNKMLNS